MPSITVRKSAPTVVAARLYQIVRLKDAADGVRCQEKTDDQQVKTRRDCLDDRNRPYLAGIRG
jgi:hypothetical protein